jgi:hypothetical protein
MISVISMMRLRYVLLVVGLLWTTTLVGQGDNTLSKQEEKDGWNLLFDGKTTKGWHGYNMKQIYSAWKVGDGELYLDVTSLDRGDIITDEEFENYELTLDWKITECGNSGIIFNSIESTKYKHAYETGPEMQILDNACAPDAKIPKHRAGNLYDLIAPAVESVKPANQWNTVKIISDKGHLELWLNGALQAETTMFTPEWEAMLQSSKWNSARYPDFGKSNKGRIMLQGDHEGRVSFRNIKIRLLK